VDLDPVVVDLDGVSEPEGRHGDDPDSEDRAQRGPVSHRMYEVVGRDGLKEPVDVDVW
jgi:hypothetical protein